MPPHEVVSSVVLGRKGTGFSCKSGLPEIVFPVGIKILKAWLSDKRTCVSFKIEIKLWKVICHRIQDKALC